MRDFLQKFEPLLRLANGPAPLPSTFGMAQSLFVRGIGAIYLIAIASWWVQLDGLVGSNGIAPVQSFIPAVKQNLGDSAFWKLPTVFLWNASNPALHWTCLLGVISAVLVMAGVLQGPFLALLWFLYLSLVNTGSVFMSFQWDILLLEAGFLSLLVAPWRLWTGPRTVDPAVSRWGIFLVHFLLWKLMIFSGAVKIASDPTWRDGTALMHHYETQPIAYAVAWYAHQLPGWVHIVSSWIMLAIEIVLPFGIFLGRRLRFVAFVGIVGLMILIMATGNFTYFNLLTIVLCLSLIDDSCWPGKIRNRFQERSLSSAKFPRRAGFGIRLAIGALLFVLSLQVCQRQLIHEAKWVKKPFLPEFLTGLNGPAQPFHLSSGYGLFRVMTRERPEIIIEGSHDGITWKSYDFRWKPDQLGERPKLVAPHQPRMDWQLWFAALGYQYQRSSRTVWFENLMVRLLQDSPEVIRLFKSNPFPDQPPKFGR